MSGSPRAILRRWFRRDRFDGEACIALLRDRAEPIVERDAAAERLMHYPTRLAPPGPRTLTVACGTGVLARQAAASVERWTAGLPSAGGG